MDPEPQPCQPDYDDFDVREQWLLRKRRRLETQQDQTHLAILSVDNALAYLRNQDGPDPPEATA